jgi:CRP-like cAMP-binding protein
VQVREVGDDEVIVQEGEAGHEFFIIKSGACHCYKTRSSSSA